MRLSQFQPTCFHCWCCYVSVGVAFLFVRMPQNGNIDRPDLPGPIFWGVYICRVQPGPKFGGRDLAWRWFPKILSFAISSAWLASVSVSASLASVSVTRQNAWNGKDGNDSCVY